jgi:hypothetical protein
MKLKLKRTECGKKATLGAISINDKHECFCIEDMDRQLEINPDAKVMHETCIPRGTYQVIITYSNRFKRELPLLVDVPGFEGIRIHPGNTDADSSGCILPATSWGRDGNANPIGGNSREAFRRLFEKIEAALDAGQSVEIEIA